LTAAKATEAFLADFANSMTSISIFYLLIDDLLFCGYYQAWIIDNPR
jgi:hypothetical protein